MSTLLVGGAGFVGLNIAEALVAREREAIVFDLNAPPEDALRAGMRAVLGDVRDTDAIAAALAPGVDTVVFGATITADARRDAADPETVLEVNLASLVPVLRRARAAGVRRVVNLSSIGAYGESGFAASALDEASTCADPRSLYALTKYATERVGERLGALWGIDFRSVRLSGVFGPWERATGVRDTLSPLFQVMACAIAGRPAVLPRACTRDWVYAPDVAAAVVALLDAPAPAHRLYNVSTGRPFSVLAWGERLAALRPGFECRLARPGETPTIDLYGERDRAAATVERARQDLGFTARFGLDESVGHWLAWAREHPWCFAPEPR
jgi:UDP-glucose 4-epimerase